MFEKDENQRGAEKQPFSHETIRRKYATNLRRNSRSASTSDESEKRQKNLPHNWRIKTAKKVKQVKKSPAVVSRQLRSYRLTTMYIKNCNTEVTCQPVIEHCKHKGVNPKAVRMVSKEISKANAFYCVFPKDSKKRLKPVISGPQKVVYQQL